MYRCKECDSKKIDKRDYKERISKLTPEQKERRKLTQRKYNKKPTVVVKSLYYAYKKIDKLKGFENNLSLEQVMGVRSLLCDYCGYPATGFDRKDNNKGHIKDNCVPCCWECNTGRMDNFTYEEMKIIGKVMKEVKDNRNTVLIPLNQ